MTTDPVPDAVGRFEVLSRLGSGGGGEVYAAIDPALKRKVALKRLLPGRADDPETRAHLLHEARTAARVRHQHIASLYDVLEVDGELWLVMEYVEGRTLQQASLPLPVDRVLEIGLQCARGLAAAHHRGIVHGDIKPGNVMVDSEGDVKILDFGVAGITGPVSEEDITMTRAWQPPGASGATVAYAAPEVLLGRDSDQRADIFSLGVMLHELLTGSNPFQAPTVNATGDRILHSMPPPLASARPEVPAELARIVHKMLSKDPDARYATVDDLIVDLKAVRGRYTGAVLQPQASVDGSGAVDLQPSVPPEAAEARLGKGWLWASAVAVLVAVVAVATSPWWPGRGGSGRGADGSAMAVADIDAPGQVVAVLPSPAVEDQDPDVAALSRGIVSILTARLAQVSQARDMQVLPSSLLQEFSISGLEEAHREMGVTLAVQVDARRVGQEVRVTTNLVDTVARRQLDADTLVEDLGEAIDLEERVSLRVMRMLHLRLQPEQEELASGTSEPRAYALYLQGRGYLADYTSPSDVESAVKLFESALEIDPGFAAAHAGLGQALWRRYEHTNDERWVRQARDECRAAVEIDEQQSMAHVCLGTVEAGTGHAAAAVEEFQRAVSLDPTLDAALLGLARAYEDDSQLDLAEVTYKEAIEARPRYWVGHNWLGLFYMRRGRFQEAADAFRDVVELTPDSYRGFTNLGVAYYSMERWDEARAAFERALQIRPEDQFALSNLGTLAFYEGDYGESARRFRQALDVDDSEYWIWGNLADALHWGSRASDADVGTDAEERAAEAYRQAIELGQHALEVNPNDVGQLRDVALYHAMLGEAEPATRLIEQALARGGTDVNTQVWAAKVYAQLGEAGRSLEHLRTALQAGYQRAEIRAEPVFDGLAGNPEFQELIAE